MQCTAQRKGGRGQCGAAAVAGTNVCRVHGGNAPQVRRRAAQRLLEASDSAAAYLVKVVEDDSKPDAVRLAAARDLLDRAGLGAKQSVELEIAPAPAQKDWRDILPHILIDVADDDHDEAGVVHRGALTATPVPPADSAEAKAQGQAARKAADPMPPGWVERHDGPTRKAGRRKPS